MPDASRFFLAVPVTSFRNMALLQSLTPSFTTPQLQSCLAFYRDLLGFHCTSEYADGGQLQWVELTNGPVMLMLLAAEAAEEGSPSEPQRYDAAGVIFYIRVAELGAVRDRLLASGAPVSRVEVTFYGMRECYVKDPDGRQLTLAEPSAPNDSVTVGEL